MPTLVIVSLTVAAVDRLYPCWRPGARTPGAAEHQRCSASQLCQPVTAVV